MLSKENIQLKKIKKIAFEDIEDKRKLSTFNQSKSRGGARIFLKRGSPKKKVIVYFFNSHRIYIWWMVTENSPFPWMNTGIYTLRDFIAWKRYNTVDLDFASNFFLDIQCK